MGVKIALSKYFEQMIKEYNKTKQKLPMAPKKKLKYSEIYIGESDEEGWCKWKPVEKNKINNFDQIEDILGININKDVKDYFNSYWFLRLDGEFKKKSINLEAVIPGEELDKFFKKLVGYKKAHNNEMKYIPIGMEEERGYLLVVENSTGKIKLENHDKGTFRTICANLEELITNLKPSIIDFD